MLSLLSPRTTSWLGFAGVAWFVATVAGAGWGWADYSHLANYISESQARGTPHGQALRTVGALPAGLLLAIFAWRARALLPASPAASLGFAVLALGYGVGTVLCALFPCDYGCGRLGGSASAAQLVHNLVGLLTYLTVPAALILLGATARRWPGGKVVSLGGLGCGLIAVTGALVFLGDLQSPFAGLVQRVTEGAILTWFVLCARYLHQSEVG